MASLNDTALLTRKVLAILAMIVGGIVLIAIIFNIGKSIKEALYPTPVAPPTVSFGKLPSIIFPQSISQQQVNYSLETVTGDFPAFPDRVTVYKLEQPVSSLLDLQNTQDVITKLNYDPTTQQQLSDTQYQWTNTDALPKTLTVNIVTKDFSLTSDFLNNPEATNTANLPDESDAIAQAKAFVDGLYGFPGDIDSGKTKTSLFYTNNGVLASADSLSNADFIRVDFFQKNVNNLPIYYPQPSQSLMNLMIAGESDAPQVVQAQFVHKAIGSDNATYPIITAKQAFDALKKGEAYIPSGPTTGTILIRNISLGYYIGDYDEQYLMPIIVLQGDNGFFAYVNALPAEWISK